MSHAAAPTGPVLYGLLGEFDTADALVKAAAAATNEGYKAMDAYSPVPIEELHHAMHLPNTKLPALVFCGALTGALLGFALENWVSIVAYPLNVGGKPLYSWPAFIPVTYECTILGAALTAVFGMLALNGLPQPYHPVFNAKRFALASRDKFFLCIEATDKKFDPTQTRTFLERIGAREVSTVED
jgi:hypothetical protein